MTLPKGLYCALITPLRDGKVDRAGLSQIIGRLREQRFAGVLVAGSTGEGPLLSDAQYRDAIARTVELAEGDLAVTAGAVETSLDRTLQRIAICRELGAAAALVMPPYYFHAEETDVLTYLRRLATRSSLPLILYNLPRISGDVFTLEILSELAECEMIAGYKDSSGDATMLRAIARELLSEDFAVFEGLATRTLQSLRDNLTGVFSGMANILPELDAAIRDLFLDGDQAGATRLQSALERLVAAVNHAGWPVGIGVKRVLSQLGFSGGETVCPIRGWNAFRMEEVEAALVQVRTSIESELSTP